ncbi:MAG: GNAT family N-acetyltransferase [Vampirovibrionia bacterium]
MNIVIEKKTFEDSTKNKPHYVVYFDTEEGEHVGGYNISGLHLYGLYVTPEFRGKGICKQIIEYAVSKKKNLNLDVDPDNIPAIKCYERAGFKFVKEITYYNPLWKDPKKKEERVLRFKHQV